MLDLMGRDYVLEHVVSVLNQEAKENAYRTYVAECLKLIAKNSAISAQCVSLGKAEAAFMPISYKELLKPQLPTQPHTAEDIIADFLNAFGGKEETE